MTQRYPTSPIFRVRPLVLALRSATLMLAAGEASALPQGAEVASGQSAIKTPTPRQMVIRQGSEKSIINWQSYNIAPAEQVRYQQPNAHSISLNRVQGAEPSGIYGKLSANGQVFLVNPNGIVFGKNARVETAGLVASTRNISDENFKAGRYTFEKSPGDSDATVVNEGKLKSKSGGYVALIGSQVSSSGRIETPKGTTALAAGERVNLDLRGDGLMGVEVDLAATKAKVDHGGVIEAPGGKVYLTAQAKDAALDTVLNVDGVVRAKTISQGHGAIRLDGGDSGTVRVAGELSATGDKSGQTGGSAEVLGHDVQLAATAQVDVSGEAGGGKAHVGGDFQGKAGTRAAHTTTVERGATIKADARQKGNGGQAVVWADGDTRFAGKISARGGRNGGDGGNAEVSGKVNLTMNGDADLRAPNGTFGNLLLDPGSINIIDSNGNQNGPNQFGDARIAELLGTGDLTISTTNATGGGLETITVDPTVNITWSAATKLSLVAGRNIAVRAGAVINNTSATTGRVAIDLTANAAGTAGGNFSGVSISAASLSAAGGSIRINGTGGNTGGGNSGVLLTNTALSTAAGSIDLTGKGGASSGNPNVGIFMQGTTTRIQAGSGNVNLTGTGGGTSAANQLSIGVGVPTEAVISVGSTSGQVSVTGTGGFGNLSNGVFNDGSLTITAGRAIDITGTGGTTDQLGIDFRAGPTGVRLSGTNGAPITLTADRMALRSTTMNTTGTVTLTGLTVGRAISVGGADNATTLGLDATDLGTIAQAGTLQIGGNTAGTVRVDAAYAPSAGIGTLALLSGATVDVGAAITGGTTRVNLNGTTGVRLGAAVSSNATNVASTRAITIRTPGLFDNIAGSGALLAPNGNWAISLATPVGQNFKGLLSRNNAVWSNPVTSNVNPTGNRYAFAIAPTIFIDAGTATKTYGDALSTTVALNNTPIASVANTFGGVFTDYANATLGGSYTRSSAGLAATANAGSYNDHTVTSVASVTSSLAGYSAAIGASGTVTVTPRSVTLTPDAQSRVYGDANPTRGTATATTGNLVNGDTVRDVALATPAVATSNVGTYDLTGSGAAFSTGLDTNYTITYAPRNGGLTVTQRPVTFTFTGFLARPYGGGAFDVSQSLSSLTAGTLANGEGFGANVNISGVDLSRPVGDYLVPQVVTIRRGGVITTPNYALTLNQATLRITPRPLTLTPDTVSRAYGDANPATGTATGNLGGLVNGDTVTSVALTTPATVTSNVGSYATTSGNAVFGTGLATNYAITYGTNAAGLNITPRLLTLTPDAVSRAYGDANPTTGTATGNLGGLVNGDTVASVSLATPATVTSNVGSYATTGGNAVFGSGLASNYAIAYASNAAGLNITPRLLSLTPDAVSRVYGDANPASGTASVTAGTLVGTDALGTVALSSPATAGSFVGTYTLSASNAAFAAGSASNYAITYNDLANGLTVTQRPVTFTLQGSISRPYGGGTVNVSIAAPTVTTGSLAAGDQIASYGFNFGGPALSAPVGTYATPFIGVSLVNAAFRNVNGNYAITRVDAPFFVTPRPVTLTPVALSRTYGDANPATAGATSNSGFGVGLVNGDTVSPLSITSPASATSNIGSYASTGSNAVFATGSASNYTITYGTNAAGLNITPRLLTLTPDAVSRAYGDANPATGTATGNLGGLVNGDAIASVDLATPATDTSNVGSYATTGGNATFGTGLATNYAITYATNAAGLNITPRLLTLTPDAVSRAYGDANPATGTATGNLGGLVNGDAIASVDLTTPATVTSNVGSYATTGGNAVFRSGLATNYAITYGTNAAGLNITPRLLTLTPDAVSRAYGDANPATGTATGNLGGLVNGDAIASVDLATPATVTSNVGSYATTGGNAVFGTGLATNYAITYATNAAGLNITPRLLTLTPDAVSRAYGDANPTTGTTTGNLGGLVNSDTVTNVSLSTPATVTSNIGSYATTGSNATFGTGLATNYAITYATNAAGLNITPRLLTLTPDAVSRAYGDANPATGTATGNLGGLVNGDTVASVDLTTPATLANNVGSYATTGGNATFGTGLATNYAITYATNATGLNITPRLLTLTPDAVSRAYGDANPATGTATGNLGGLVNGDTVTNVSLSTPATVTSNIGSYATTGSNAVFGSGLASNYAITYDTNAAGLNITPRLLTLTPDSVSRTYGDANPTNGTATGNLGGLVNGDTVTSVALTTPATVASNVGSYATTGGNAIFGSGLASNYAISYGANPAGLTINPATLTYVADPASRFVSERNPVFSGSVTGFKLNDTLAAATTGALTFTSPATRASVPGTYPIDGSGLAANNGNYVFVQDPANASALAISPAERIPPVATETGPTAAEIQSRQVASLMTNSQFLNAKGASVSSSASGLFSFVCTGIRLPGENCPETSE